MRSENATLGQLSVGGKGNYGIAASAVPYSENLLTYLRITDISDQGTLKKQSLMSVADENADKYLLKPNDIVFARTGNSTGRNYFYDGTDGNFVYAGFLIKFSLDPQKVNPRYIKYYCQSSQYWNWVQSFNTGSTRGNINAQTFANMEIPLPPREQQDFLVRLLSPLDDKIELNQKIKDNLQRQAQAIYQSWFIDFTPFGDVMPKIWKIAKLGDISTVTSGKRPPVKTGEKANDLQIPLVGAASVMGYTNAVLYDAPILVTGRVGTHGVVQRFRTPCWPSDNTLVITSRYYEFVHQVLQNIDYANMNRGSTQPLITQTDLKNVEIVLPPSDILDQFEIQVGQLMRLWEQKRIESEKLSALRDTLLPKLMSGEINFQEV